MSSNKKENNRKMLKEKLKDRKTQGFKKIKNYFLEVVRSETFQMAVSYIRNMYYIPKDGFPSPYKDGSPDLFEPLECSKEWIFINDKKEIGFFEADIETLRRRFALYPYSVWHFVIRNYVFYNKLPDLDKNLEEGCDLCEISDIEAEKKTLAEYQKSKKYKNFADAFVEHLAERDKLFPVRINVSPYASKRDILDFVRKNYNYIKEIQDRHKIKMIKIGKVRSRNPYIQQRNDFIYKHRHLPRRAIMRLVSEKFNEVLDYGHISKIISLEKKRRKEL